MEQQKKKPPLRLLTSAPNKNYSRLVVRYPHQTDEEYAHAYHLSAERLATTFSGKPIDDCLLLPFLTLYRHAFELQLKNTIRSLAWLRIRYTEGRTPELLEAGSKEHFKDKLGHNLHRLLNEAKKHFEALELPQVFPKSIEGMVMKLHEADSVGTAFRYAGLLPESQEHADFPDLAAMLNREFELLCLVTSYAEEFYSSVPTRDEMKRDLYQDTDAPLI